MSAPVKTVGYRRARRARWGAALVAATGLALGVVNAQTPVPKPGMRLALPATPAAPTASPVAYQLRCWQHGHLMLEELLTELPADSGSQSVRLRGPHPANVRGSPYLIFSLGTATCLAKPAAESGTGGV